MRSIHEQELAVENPDGNAEFERRLEALRNKWLELAGRYTEAVERFTTELERARSGSGGDGRSA
jgi:hypothetical protein